MLHWLVSQIERGSSSPCAASVCVTPKTISHQNQKTNTTPQLFCTLDTLVSNTKTYFLSETKKTDTTSQLEKKFLQPTCSKCICFSICNSVCLSVMAKRGIWSKRVLMRTNGNFSFCVH
jgi:hypothetical protein